MNIDRFQKSTATIKNFIADQIYNAETEEAYKLAIAIHDAIVEFKENGGQNENAFSLNAYYEDGNFTAECDFSANLSMTILYEFHEVDNDKSIVESLFNLDNEKELLRLAGLMISEEWVIIN